MIEVRNVSKFYGNFQALDDISFRVNKGEILGFLGPNGAGKTTTMRIITGFMPPSRGDCLIGGKSILEKPLEVKRKIGYLPENPPLYPEFTVFEYLFFVGKLRGMSKNEILENIKSLEKKCGIGDVRNKIISKLSKGYKQRVGIAQALLHNPDVVILDEPTIGLDPVQIKEVRELIKELGGDHTVILSSHILPEVSQVCDRILIINRGKIVAEDTPENLTGRIRGEMRCRISLKGEEEKVRDVLQKFSDNFEVSGDGEKKVSITLKSDEDIRPLILRELVNTPDIEVFEFYTEKLTLEDIFLHLVTEEENGRSEE